MNAVLSWFAPPDLSQPDLRRRGRALWIVSWPFLAVVILALGIAVLVEPDTLSRRSTTVAAVGALIFVLHALSRSGRPVLASWILVIGLSVVVTQRAWITGGIHAPVSVFYALFIVMAGVLIGTRGGLATAAVCFLGAILLAVGTARGWLVARPGAGSPAGAFVFVVLAIGLALVVQALVSRRPPREGLGPDAVQMLVNGLRSPLQGLLAHLALLRQVSRGEGSSYVDGAMGGANMLQQMTASLLDVAKLEAGRMPLKPHAADLSILAHAAVAAVRVTQPTRNITIEALGDPACTCDPELTRRIIENLVTNAAKHTTLDAKVRVVISGSSSRAQIAVHDEGPGVPPENRSRIFEPYGATGSRSAAGFESSGMGLAFCRAAAEAQGGSVRHEDGATGGSVFVVELPRVVRVDQAEALRANV